MMKKYEVQKLIESGKLDITKLSSEDKELIDDLKLATNNWKEEDKDARSGDKAFAKHLKSTKAYNQQQKSTPPKDKAWPHKKNPGDIKESIAQGDADAAKSVKLFEGLDKKSLDYFYDYLVNTFYAFDDTTVKEQKEDMKYLISEHKKKKSASKKSDQKITPYKIGDMWKKSFDYDGMIIKGMESQISWDQKKLQQLFDSFEDVNYHSDAKPLYKAITALKEGDKEKAQKEHTEFVEGLKKSYPDLVSKANISSSKKSQSKKTDPKKVDKAVDGIIGKPMYFKGDKGTWIEAKIHNALPINKKMDRWAIEFYPIGSKGELQFPLVSDQLTTDQMQKFIDREEVKGYTMKKPTEKVISDFDEASKQIDECVERSKTERIEKIIEKGPTPKKTTFTVFKDSTRTYANKMVKITKEEKPEDPKMMHKVNKVVETAQMQIKDLLFGDGKKTDQVQKIIDKAFGKK